MEPAFAGQALIQPGRFQARGGRRLAALLLFWAFCGGCGGGSGPAIVQRLRVGLGVDSLSLSPDGDKLAVACRRSNDVWVLAMPSGDLLERVDTMPRPRAVFFHPAGLTFYVAEGLSSVAQVRLSDRRVARRFRPRWRITHLALEPKSGRLFGGHLGVPLLGVYRLKDMHMETTVAVGGEVVDLAFGPRDAWVLTSQADGLSRLSLTDMSVRTAALAGPDPRALEADTGRGWAYVACHGRAGEVGDLVVPTPAPSPETLSPLSGTADQDDDSAVAGDEDAAGDTDEAVGPDEEEAPAPGGEHRWDGGGVAVFRLDELRRVDYVPVPGGPVALAVSDSGRTAAVACEDGHLRIVELASREVVADLAVGGRPTALLRLGGGRGLLLALSDQKNLLRILPGSLWQ
jgi:DNA-binding beta-propeller fold protein YncE